TVFMDRFHVVGWRRWYLVEPVSEALSLGTGGLILMLALAIPAFRETSDDDWLKKSELAVTFLDRYGNEIGSRGIRHNDYIWLEVRLPKNEIFKLYLDRAYLGGGTFGVDAAAQYYFNKSARDVNLAEAAMLAGMFKAPSKFAPHVNLPAARARANVVLDNLVEAGFMTEGQVFGARRNPALAVDRRDERSPNHYLDGALDEKKTLIDAL